ncbi:Nif3-like dinuclear metal center hexameric protein [Alkaliphilus serpentinus]|uniref:GTP cyclohydrolase 1 type 2 homolog n=1 Tax=Alkaliphilus serpentinus TaxID=1482731 RepID=A0A833MBG8_9FIRM|nr:Nif3-like dinuclear metal center hexameric protein [Alkaliphilus serpentinus]KAB3533232.1 Nif3-like dinuclear metal center hexameric protein [Alkaliphilus serpentinus]
MSTRVKEIVDLMETFAPSKESMSWDNVGLQVGSLNHRLKKVLVCLDVNEAVIDEAIEVGANMIIAHHPLIFKAMAKISEEDVKGKIISKAIKNNISIYVSHTNIDIVDGGLNDYIVYKLGLSNTTILDIEDVEKLYKLAVFVPTSYTEVLAEAMAAAGGGHIGNYSHCSFRTSGIGTFKPLEGSQPFIGNKGQLERVEEVKLEAIVREKDLTVVLNEILRSHPYEEVAYDIYPLHNEGRLNGAGRIATLENSMLLSLFVEGIKASLNLDKVKVAGDVNSNIVKVAVVNGSGGDYIKAAIKAKCDCLITGDIKFHDAQMALDHGLNIIDIGHYESEIPFIEMVTEYLQNTLVHKKIQVVVIPSQVYSNPFQIL